MMQYDGSTNPAGFRADLLIQQPQNKAQDRALVVSVRDAMTGGNRCFRKDRGKSTHVGPAPGHLRAIFHAEGSVPKHRVDRAYASNQVSFNPCGTRKTETTAGQPAGSDLQPKAESIRVQRSFCSKECPNNWERFGEEGFCQDHPTNHI
jgi:hypothetical protein